MALINRQVFFTTKIVENMIPRERAVAREALDQYPEQTRRIVKQAIAMHQMKASGVGDLVL